MLFASRERGRLVPQIKLRGEMAWRRMSGAVDKMSILGVGDFMAINRKGCEIDQALRMLVVVTQTVLRAAHEEFSGWNHDHVRESPGLGG